MKKKIEVFILILSFFGIINMKQFLVFAQDIVPLGDAINDINTTINSGLVPDSAKDTFKQDVSRGSFINMLMHTMLLQLQHNGEFSDADKKILYKDINYLDLSANTKDMDKIALAAYLGIIKNVSPKRMGIDDVIGREEAAQMVFIYYNLFPDIKKNTKSGKIELSKLGSLKKERDKILKNFDIYLYNDLIYGLEDKSAIDAKKVDRVSLLLLIKRFYVYTGGDAKFLKAASNNKISSSSDNVVLMYKFRNNMFIDPKKANLKEDILIDKNVKELLSFINEERKKAGRTSLRYSFDLDGYANIRAKELVKEFSHTRPDGTEFYSGTPYKSGVAEDIAAGYSDAKNLFKSWMEIPEYTKGIIRAEYDKVSFGYHKDDKNKHKHFWVQLLFDEFHNNGLLNDPKVKDQGEFIKTSKKKVLALVNVERKKVGLNSLVEFTEIGDYSDLRATELPKKFSHTRPDGSDFASGMKYKYGVGENIAGGQVSAEDVMRDWMNSPGHRENILRPEYDKMSVGFVIIPNTQYTYYWVQTFYAEE